PRLRVRHGGQRRAVLVGEAEPREISFRLLAGESVGVEGEDEGRPVGDRRLFDPEQDRDLHPPPGSLDEEGPLPLARRRRDRDVPIEEDVGGALIREGGGEDLSSPAAEKWIREGRLRTGDENREERAGHGPLRSREENRNRGALPAPLEDERGADVLP